MKIVHFSQMTQIAVNWMPPRHDRYHQPEYNNKNDPEIDLPPSLKEAIISFILKMGVEILEAM